MYLPVFDPLAHAFALFMDCYKVVLKKEML